MIELALEKYPSRSDLSNGVQALVRPLETDDEHAFKTFLEAVPEIERMFIKQNVQDPKLLENWCHDLDYEAELPLLAFADGKVIGLVALQQRLGGWKRHIARVRLLTHPGYRGIGLATLLLTEIAEMARHAGVTRLEFECNAEREIAQIAFAEYGFEAFMRLPNYVRDMQGITHDFVMMGMDLSTDPEFAGAGD
ncbi:MAG: GNAT family N-acetyltransferase [Verrucomicrobiales bacterium]|nr:GNAT family N-acetyltransferase [Verrucomicrobiales bacterium]